MALADIQKLVENMKRANALTARAAESAPKHALIMDNFEARMIINDENMGKIDEYEKLMAAMDQGSNGGPPLVTTFSSNAQGTTVGSTAVAPFDHATGDPLRT